MRLAAALSVSAPQSFATLESLYLSSTSQKGPRLLSSAIFSVTLQQVFFRCSLSLCSACWWCACSWSASPPSSTARPGSWPRRRRRSWQIWPLIQKKAQLFSLLLLPLLTGGAVGCHSFHQRNQIGFHLCLLLLQLQWQPTYLSSPPPRLGSSPPLPLPPPPSPPPPPQPCCALQVLLPQFLLQGFATILPFCWRLFLSSLRLLSWYLHGYSKFGTTIFMLYSVIQFWHSSL